MSTLSSLSTTVNVIDKVDKFDGVTVDDLLEMGWYHTGEVVRWQWLPEGEKEL